MGTEEIIDVYLEVSRTFRQLEVALLVSLEGGCLSLVSGTRVAFVPVESRETALEACQAFAYSVGLGLVRNCKPELN